MVGVRIGGELNVRLVVSFDTDFFGKKVVNFWMGKVLENCEFHFWQRTLVDLRIENSTLSTVLLELLSNSSSKLQGPPCTGRNPFSRVTFAFIREPNSEVISPSVSDLERIFWNPTISCFAS